jgi:hypothetical protein
MKLNFKFMPLAALLLSSFVVGCATVASGPPADSNSATEAPSGSWAWKYMTFDVLSGEALGAGRVELTGRPGAYKVRLVLKNPAVCNVGSNPATVTSTGADLVITTSPTLSGCAVRRFTIRKDGTGGTLDTLATSKSGSTWVPDEYDRGLTPL